MCAGPVRGQCVGDKVRQQTVEQRRHPPVVGSTSSPVGLQRLSVKGSAYCAASSRKILAEFPQLPQQVDGPRHTGAVQQRRRGRVRRLVPQPPQAEQLRLQFLQQRRQLGALRRV